MTKEQLKQLENDLWSAADTLRANSDLKSSEYSTPVLGLIFLKFADNKYRKHEPAILKEYDTLKGTRREKPLSDIALEKCGFYLPDHARYDYLLTLPEQENIAKAIKEATRAKKPSPTPTICGSICLLLRSSRKAAPRWSWPIRPQTPDTPRPRFVKPSSRRISFTAC